MKDERIIKAFDSVAPDDAAKKRMLDAILSEQDQEELTTGFLEQEAEDAVATEKAPKHARVAVLGDEADDAGADEADDAGADEAKAAVADAEPVEVQTRLTGKKAHASDARKKVAEQPEDGWAQVDDAESPHDKPSKQAAFDFEMSNARKNQGELWDANTQIPFVSPAPQQKKSDPLGNFAIAACLVLAVGLGIYALTGVFPSGSSSPASLTASNAEVAADSGAESSAAKDAASATESSDAAGSQNATSEESAGKASASKSASTQDYAGKYELTWNAKKYVSSKVVTDEVGPSLGRGSLSSLAEQDASVFVEVYECADTRADGAVAVRFPEDKGGVVVVFLPL